MFIPITHERTSVGSFPWVSVAVVALCLLLFGYVRSRLDRVDASAAAFSEAFIHYVEHPYLEPDPRLVSAQGVEQVRRELGGRAPADAVPELHQRRLDELTAAWLASLEANPLWHLGMVPDTVRPLGTVAHMFTHAGWLHLLGNLLFFYLTAPFVEDRFGHGPFAAFYLAAGVIAGFAHCLHYPNLHVPLIGASGAISATMGAFVILFGQTRVRILTFILLIPKTFEAPAWVIFPLWFAADLLMAVEGSRADPAGLLSSTAYWAHVGGFVVGVAVAFGVRMVKPGSPAGDPVAAPWLEVPDAPPTQRDVRTALRAGDAAGAWRLWQQLDLHDRAAARRPDLAVAMAEALPALGRHAEADELLREAAEGAGPDTPIGVLLKLLRLTRGGEAELRRRVAAAVRDHPQTPPEMRRQVDGELIVQG